MEDHAGTNRPKGLALHDLPKRAGNTPPRDPASSGNHYSDRLLRVRAGIRQYPPDNYGGQTRRGSAGPCIETAGGLK